MYPVFLMCVQIFSAPHQWPHLTCSWVFAPSVMCRAPDTLHPVPLLCLCAQLYQQTWRREPSHILFILFQSFVQVWTQAQCLFHACVVWIHIRDVKLPFSWLGSSWAWGSPHWSVSSNVQTVGSQVVQKDREGGSRVFSFIAPNSRGPWWTSECKCP